MALCTVTGAVYLPSGELARSTMIKFTRVDKSVNAEYLGAVVPADVFTKTDRLGRVDFEILTGRYTMHVAEYSGGAVVPEADAATISDILTIITPGIPVPAWLAEAFAARDAAVDAADAAQQAAQDAISAGDAAFVNANVYPDVATGRAAVSDGVQFSVVSGAEIIRYRRDSSTTQTEVARFPSSAVLSQVPIRTTTINSLSNTVVVNTLNGPSNPSDGMIFEVNFVAANGGSIVLKVGTAPTYPLYDAYGANLPRNSVSAGQVALVKFIATPVPQFRMYQKDNKSGILQMFTSRGRLDEAAAQSATLSDDAVLVAGFGSAGDGGNCLMTRTSQVFRSAAGFGIVVDSSVRKQAFGLGLNGSLEVEQPAPTSDTWRTAKARFQDDTSRVLSPTGLTFLNGADFERLHSIRSTADGQTAELDASTIPNNRPYKITSLARTGSTFVIDGGAGAIWEAEGGGRYLVCQAGATIEFIKVEQNRLYVTALRGGTVTSTNTFTRAVRGQSVLLAGQSILRQAFGAGDGAGAFFDRNAALFSGQTTNFINVALGGSGICERDIASSDYWVNMTNPASPSDGPLLTAAAAVIASRDGDLTQPQISAILWDQGQTSAGLVDATDAPNANFTRQMYTDASVYALNRLRAMVGGSPTVIFQRLGRARRPVVSDLRWQAIREAQRDVVAAVSGAVLGPETWDLPYKDNLHPDSWGQFNEGVRLAEALATVRGASGLTGPLTINTVTYNTAGRYIDAALSGSPLRFPDPAGFVVMDASGTRVNIARIHWSSTTTARLFLEAEATGGTLYYGWGIIEIADDRLIPRRSQSLSIATLAQPIRPSLHAL